jgi:hypothetical protein
MQQSKSMRALATGTGAACTVRSAQGEPHGGSQPPADGRACPAKRTLARLLIHATDGVAEGSGVLPGFMSRLRAWATAMAQPGQPALVGLRVADLQGRQFFSADALTSVVDMPLPAGTYHVTVNLGRQERRYTVALEQGATFDLHLRATADRR